ncbi:T-complex protein 1 subunit delta [Trichinella nelsoni]|uniref:T-complex protein 1 subunit delta n=3 Tax=Trichinella TaxID=6333 RepID=A0A0V0SD28_9BILA|nr:T-complex protein 1 subunit delta [Trichinella nelsoni]KRY32039.1 T-complex protein 1 subunit delta [Trichinella spiralis]
MASQSKTKQGSFKDVTKDREMRNSNIVAAKAVADAIRTSLGPKGMDKMIEQSSGEILISNDGATILNEMHVLHPAAQMLVQLAKAQDIEAGDGTSTVVVIAGQLLEAAGKLYEKGLHPTLISESFLEATKIAEEVVVGMSKPVDINDNELMQKIAKTSLNSKVVSSHARQLAPMAVEAVKKVATFGEDNASLNLIKVVKKLGGTIEDSYMVNGTVLDTHTVGAPGAPKRMEKAKIGLIQFHISPPKPDMNFEVVLNDYSQMDRQLREERDYILNICKQIKKAGCNVLLLQKSILRDAVTELSLHYLAKLKIMVIKDIEREDIRFVMTSLGCRPVASLDHFVPEALGYADLVEEIRLDSGERLIQFTGVQNPGKTASIVLRGSNRLVLDEAERSLHDALAVLRCLYKKKLLICGGGAPEMEVACRLRSLALEHPGMLSFVFQSFADALEVIPYTLAENAGLRPIETITELRHRHVNGDSAAGINVRKGCITSMYEENVVQPALVTISALTLASEAVRSILKIDDILRATRDI